MNAIHFLWWYRAAALAATGLLTGCALPGPGGEAPTLTGEYISASEADVKPVALSRTAPVYPARLQRMAIHGEVVILFIVETDGTVREAEAEGPGEATDDQREFMAAALTAVRQWRFQPAVKAGVPVRVVLEVPIRFGEA